ncbi:MAG: thioredoxin domain-containing protein [Candidatus Saccharimonadales bacterium]
MKRLLLLVPIIIAAAVGLFLVNGRGDLKPSANSTSPVSENSELIIGSVDAPATIIAYEDFKCPSCNQFHQNAERQIRENYINKGKLKIIFRPYPVYGEDAGEGLYGAYCANDQGKFIAYHDELFDYMWNTFYKAGNFEAALETTLTNDLMLTTASKIGLDKQKFADCLAGETHNSKFEQALSQAASDEIQGTPSFIINNQKVVGPQPYSVFKTLIDIQLR